MSSKIFYFNGDPEKPIKAAGLILSKVIDGHTYFLMQMVQKDRNIVYEDFGGKIENIDTDWCDIILREVAEESNGVLNAHDLRERIMAATDTTYYHARSKYVFVVLPATLREASLTGEEFGDSEHDAVKFQIHRTVRWINSTDIAFRWRTSLHYRLRIPGVFNNRRKSTSTTTTTSSSSKKSSKSSKSTTVLQFRNKFSVLNTEDD